MCVYKRGHVTKLLKSVESSEFKDIKRRVDHCGENPKETDQSLYVSVSFGQIETPIG